MVKRYLAIFLSVLLMVVLTGCLEGEKAPKETELPTLSPLNGNVLENTHEVEGMKFISSYNTGQYNLGRWRITDSKTINMSSRIQDVPKGTTVLVEHVHIDMSLKSTNPQLDGLPQDSMDDSYHGSSQDGFYINPDYNYENKFAVEGFSQTLTSGWGFVCNDYGTIEVSQKKLTEENLIKYGEVYANKMQVIYDLLVKNEGEEYFHTYSIMDEFLIPVGVQNQKD